MTTATAAQEQYGYDGVVDGHAADRRRRSATTGCAPSSAPWTDGRSRTSATARPRRPGGGRLARGSSISSRRSAARRGRGAVPRLGRGAVGDARELDARAGGTRGVSTRSTTGRRVGCRRTSSATACGRGRSPDATAADRRGLATSSSRRDALAAVSARLGAIAPERRRDALRGGRHDRGARSARDRPGAPCRDVAETLIATRGRSQPRGRHSSRWASPGRRRVPASTRASPRSPPATWMARQGASLATAALLAGAEEVGRGRAVAIGAVVVWAWCCWRCSRPGPASGQGSARRRLPAQRGVAAVAVRRTGRGGARAATPVPTRRRGPTHRLHSRPRPTRPRPTLPAEAVPRAPPRPATPNAPGAEPD